MRKSIVVVFLFFVFPRLLVSQNSNEKEIQYNLDSLLNVFKQFHTFSEQKFSPSDLPEKCGTWIIQYLQTHRNELTLQQQREFDELLTPKFFQNDTTIGNFHFYFNTTGDSSAALLDASGNRIEGTARAYIESVAVYLQTSYNIEVDSLGYHPLFFLPLRVEIRALNRMYGYATSFSVTLDNDYSNEPCRPESCFSTSGLDGAKVTAAHELHHVIQYTYGLNPPSFFMELTSTWMEDVVYNDVNDYYNYLRDPSGHFANPQLSFFDDIGNLEYSRAVWGKFLEDKFLHDSSDKNIGREIMKKTWDNIGDRIPIMQAIDDAAKQFGGFDNLYTEFSYWNFFIGNNADTVRYFVEGKHYYWYEKIGSYYYVRNSVRFDKPILANRTILEIENTQENFSARYIPITFGDDTVFTMIARHSMNDTSSFFRYTIQAGEGDTLFYSLPNHYSARLEYFKHNLWTDADSNWTSRELITRFQSEEKLLVYPNPFVYDGTQTLKIQLPPKRKGTMALLILASDLTAVFERSRMQETEDFQNSIGYRNAVIEWNGKADNGTIPSSGVYFYVLTVNDKQWKGKFAFIRK